MFKLDLQLFASKKRGWNQTEKRIVTQNQKD